HSEQQSLPPVNSFWALHIPIVAALDLFARFQIFQRDLGFPGLLALILFHVGSSGWFVGGCELSVAPNNNPFPPVTLFLGIRSCNRMPEVFFGPGPARLKDLAAD